MSFLPYAPQMTGSTTVHFRIAWAAFKTYRRVLVISELILFGSWVSLELAVVAVHRWGMLPNLALHLAFLFLFSGLMVGIESIALQVGECGVSVRNRQAKLSGAKRRQPEDAQTRQNLRG